MINIDISELEYVRGKPEAVKKANEFLIIPSGYRGVIDERIRNSWDVDMPVRVRVIKFFYRGNVGNDRAPQFDGCNQVRLPHIISLSGSRSRLMSRRTGIHTGVARSNTDRTRGPYCH